MPPMLMHIKRHPYLATVLFLTLVGGGLRLLTWPLLGFSGDEAWTIRWAAQPVTHIMHRLDVGLTMHLYILAMKVWGHVAGYSPQAWKLPSLVAGILAIPLLYRLAAPYAGQRTALLACLLLALSLPAIHYSRTARVYALLTDAGMISCWLYLRAWTGPQRHALVLLSFTHAIALMLSPNAAYLLLVQGLSALIETRPVNSETLRRLGRMVVALGLAVAGAMLFYAGLVPQVLSALSVYTGGGQRGFTIVVDIMKGLHPWATPAFAVLMVVGGGPAWRSGAAGRLLVLMAVVPLLAYAGVGARMPAPALTRFLVPILPAHMLLIAIGARWITGRFQTLGSARAAGAILLSLLALDAVRHPDRLKPLYQEPTPSRAATRILRTIATPNDLITSDPDHLRWILFHPVAATNLPLSRLTGDFPVHADARLLILAEDLTSAHDQWSTCFSILPMNGPRYRDALVVLQSTAMRDTDDLNRMLECYLRGAVAGLATIPPRAILPRHYHQLADRHRQLALLLERRNAVVEAGEHHRLADANRERALRSGQHVR